MASTRAAWQPSAGRADAVGLRVRCSEGEAAAAPRVKPASTPHHITGRSVPAQGSRGPPSCPRPSLLSGTCRGGDQNHCTYFFFPPHLKLCKCPRFPQKHCRIGAGLQVELQLEEEHGKCGRGDCCGQRRCGLRPGTDLGPLL